MIEQQPETPLELPASDAQSGAPDIFEQVMDGFLAGCEERQLNTAFALAVSPEGRVLVRYNGDTYTLLKQLRRAYIVLRQQLDSELDIHTG
jgi:hypothetical protein